MIDVKTRRGGADATCPLCREALERAGEDSASCRGCETRYHASCMAELGGCSTLGCSLKGVAVGTARTLGCGVCGRLAAEPLSRRRCGCGATVHQVCVDAHAATCDRGRRLQADAWRPVEVARERTGGAGAAIVYGTLVQLGVTGALLGLLTSRLDLPGLVLVGFLVTGWARQAYEDLLARTRSPEEERAVLIAALALLVPVVGLLAWLLISRREDD